MQKQPTRKGSDSINPIHIVLIGLVAAILASFTTAYYVAVGEQFSIRFMLSLGILLGAIALVVVGQKRRVDQGRCRKTR
ncbi:hypothetical protein CEPID_01100 [Corynebacterium epidermidicanis]|uniref:Uncharacterized protein n=1 Tax=Corynebacterium epidermidicanis TaxID=1050174 RepID=A0A0G3GNJ7_9CORY|nr:hypothetical protein CEPID_01100 [Corynebacterium epidermidicanis]